MNPLDFTAGPFLTFYSCLALLAWLAADYISRQIGPAGGATPPLTFAELAYLSGGEPRVVDAVLVELLMSGVATLSPNGRTVEIDGDRVAGLRTLPEINWLQLNGAMPRSTFRSRLSPMVNAIRAKLQEMGLVTSDSAIPAYRLKVILIFAVPILIGIAKVNVGIERDKPVGILIFLLLLTAAMAVHYLEAPRKTRAGRKALAAARTQNARAARAPLDGEWTMAVALTGAIVLSGTAYEGVNAGSADSGAGGGGDGGSGDGGGDGGGGCGGCGGG